MRPYVICHMTTSIDGKVTGNFLFREEGVPATEEYYRLNRVFPAEASRYVVAFDRKGRLGWKSSTIEDEAPGY